MFLYLIRHAQSTNNALPLTQRVQDPPLTALGLEQAATLAQHLADAVDRERAVNGRGRTGYSLTRLYCSAMGRALQTAQFVGQALDLKPEVWVDIHEQGGIFLDHGEAGGAVGYPGKTRAEILAEFPHFSLPENVTEEGWWNRGYEDWPTCQGRAIKVAQQLQSWAAEAHQAGRSERLALVTHGGFLDALLKALTSQLPSRHLYYGHYNTGITCLEFRADGRLFFYYLNRIEHLPPELISY